MNSLDIIIGPMYAGKSTELMRRLIIASELGLKVLFINHKFDTRGEHIFTTHHPFLIPQNHTNIDFLSVNSLKGIRKEEYDVIGIDEAQFFDHYLFEFCKVHVELYRRQVIVSGLDSDYRRNAFGHILELIPLSDSVVKMKPYCQDCGIKMKPAIFSHMYRADVHDGTILVGGKEEYKPLCRDCYIKIN